MKQFFKFMFASMLGFFLVTVILFFLFLGAISTWSRFGQRDTVQVSPGSVLQLALNAEIVDRGGASPFDSFDPFAMGISRNIGLNDLLNNLKKAKNDDNIEGILLDLSGFQAGMATVGEIRQALEDFKASGKFVISYGETYSQRGYYLATVADRVYLHPEGIIDFRGLNAEVMFFTNMLDKLGIEPQIIRHGQFKSAVEPFMLEQMSPENREQVLSYTNTIWNNILDDISRSRATTVNQLHDVADRFLTRNASLALEAQMIDGILFQDEVTDELRNRLQLAEDASVPLVSYTRYMRAPGEVRARSGRDQIAVIYGTGNILPGQGGETSMGSNRIAEAIREARLNDRVKAIVFRINSPGGSALASDVILREVKLASEVKPVIASMGDVAASGGYYVACAADLIVASPNTITGSIGVFGLYPNMQEFFNEKIGITFDNVKTNQYADLGSVSRPFTRNERAIIQEFIEQVYETFISHVSRGRNMPEEEVDMLGQGRVWSGTQALRNGLIDEFGGLQYSIERAAELAEVTDYRLVEYPRRRDWITRLREDFGGLQEAMLRKKLGDSYIFYQHIQDVQQMKGVQARLPYNIILE